MVVVVITCNEDDIRANNNYNSINPWIIHSINSTKVNKLIVEQLTYNAVIDNLDLQSATIKNM